MQMKTGVEQAVYATFMLSFLPDKAVLPGEVISQRIGASPTYFQKLLRKLVSADLITSVAGVKGGFKLQRRPEQISVYDIYMAIEGKQSLYSSNGIIQDMLHISPSAQCCLLSDLMEEAESAWITVLKKETIASLVEKFQTATYQQEIESFHRWLDAKIVY
ncbi:RrF2 family transcriptional regulator [Paenibacillus endoradicis]|uniref:RrF2 family transcriptional regulator n=1 Tax=Paenibacillus endoradicis TaxID=2972487 RepID=UPI002158F296|nr:Rrf2 family transcriptional regulator [Paenibacillus endoradicis]MCR8658752.1 Rrf2 family transcriptional regulator [Paenibacillus endoradicis]